MPFTNARAYRAAPISLQAASGLYYRNGDGAAVLDATSGLWCVNFGHCRPEIIAAITRQAEQLDYAPGFQIGHPVAFQYAQRLSDILPAELDHIFFANSGSEAVDSALKIALAYQRAIGQGGRTRLIGRERGYHGANFGGISVGGLGANRRGFGPLLPGVDHLRHTYTPQSAFSRGQPVDGADLANDLERLVTLHGAETIAAVIVEPLAGSTGVLAPPVGYLERLGQIARRHGILLIFDEVITAFGRLGAATAADRFGVTPDLLVMAKGMTNGAVPMGAVAVASPIHEAIINAAEPGIELFHGYTCSGHPLAAAAGLAVLDLCASDGLFERARQLGDPFEDAVHDLRGARHIIDIRNLGLACGIELEPRPDAPGARGAEVFRACFDRGLLVRVTGDTIALAPAVTIAADQIDQITATIRAVLTSLS